MEKLEEKEIFKKIDESILNTYQKKVLINGKGHIFQEAIANAFEKLKVISYNLSQNMLISMNTIEVVLKKYSKKDRAIKVTKKSEIHDVELEVTLEIKNIKI